jgi:hypothetical protein
VFTVTNRGHKTLQHNHSFKTTVVPTAPKLRISMAPYMIDYNKILACWAKQHKLDINVNELLNKSKGKEFKLCLRLSNQYGKPNPLNNIFQSRLESIDATNYRKLTELILSVFYPSELSEVRSLCGEDLVVGCNYLNSHPHTHRSTISCSSTRGEKRS